MGLYIRKSELIRRINNGFLSSDGYVDNKFFDIYRKNDINIHEVWNARLLKCIMEIINSMDSEAIDLFPKDLRGSKIRDIRVKQDRSIEWLSKKSGVSRTAIYDIEDGLSIPHKSTLEKIAKALKVEVEDLG